MPSGNHGRPFWVARSDLDAARTALQLQHVGINAQPLPLLTIDFLTQDVPSADYLLITSANGVRAWAKAGGSSALPVFAVGQASAAEAGRLGHPIAGIGDGDVHGLAREVLAHAPEGRLLHVAGRDRAGDLLDLLRAGGQRADRIVLYNAAAASRLPDAFMDADEPADIGFFSPRLAAQFVTLWQGRGPSPMRAFCLSDRVRDAAIKGPFSKLFVAPEPTLAAFVDTVKAECP